MSPHDATVQAMHEVSGPVVGIALVLTAVFIPVAFLGGLTGQLYQQFALTIAISVLISAFNALSLSPALCALLLKPAAGRGGWLRPFFSRFERAFSATTRGYMRVTGMLVRRAVISILVIVVVAIAAGGLSRVLPTGFIPEEDQGILLINVQLPSAASLERTEAVCRKIEEILGRTPGIESFNVVGGLSFLSFTFNSYSASFFVRLTPWEERESPELSIQGITARLMREFSQVPEATIIPIAPPPIPGFSAAGGFSFILQDRSGALSVEELGAHARQFIAAASRRPEITRIFTGFDPAVPQLSLRADREKARTLGVPIIELFETLQATLGGAYINDFNRFGRLYRVYLQAAPESRQSPADIGRFYVRSATTGEMIPLSTLVDVEPSSGAEMTMRYNLYRAVEITGAAADGYSSGQAMAALEEVARQVLPAQMSWEFTGLSFQERRAPDPLPTLVLAVVFVFLLLAALYESWSLPFSVLLGTPLVALGAFLGIWLRGFENNIFVQIGLVMLIGLAAKNAILIVEFAKIRKESGMSSREAALEGARIRFRPILMTAFAFLFGVIPLMRATGSGANSRQIMGTAVFSGMLVATALAVFLVPAFFVLVEGLRDRARRHHPPAPTPPPPRP